MPSDHDEVSVKVPQSIAKLVEKLASRARQLAWGEFTFTLKAGKPVGFMKRTESESIE